ncbi:MAG: hypothetical protein GY773_13605, partial [Actinomycetia bacterium]|nr:hypothetical protein [Actinomycetes bacterium]
NRRTNDSITDLHLVSTHKRIDSVVQSMPVTRRSGPVFNSDLTGNFVFIDADLAPDVVQIRSDLAPEFTELMAALAAERPEMASVELPGEPHGVELSLTVAEEELIAPDDEVLPLAFDARVALVIQDGNKMLHRIVAGELVSGGDSQRLAIDLTAQLSDGTSATPTFPLSVVDIEIRSLAPAPPQRLVTVMVEQIIVVDEAGASAVAPNDSSPRTWTVGQTRNFGLVTAPSLA